MAISSTNLIVGLEVHVELATRTKMFTRAPNPAAGPAAAHSPSNPATPHPHDPPPNSLIDPVVLALPGALPVLNKRAIDMAIMVGLALNCSIAPLTKWDRKSYFYPDLPKNYQISQYDLPLCFDGSFDLPDPADPDDQRSIRIGIVRAHLEEDAGKLLHEAPGGLHIDHSIVDYNRAGTPLLEIVTAPDFTTADQVVAFAQTLRNICRALGVTQGIMNKGHIRFEPNINCVLTLDDGRRAITPIVEVKNLNSFKSLKGAIEYELREQPRRYLQDQRVMAPGSKTTRGWDDTRALTFLQREKEDAHDYRYFPDPDLPMVRVTDQWRDALRDAIPELPHLRAARYHTRYALGKKEAAALVEEPETAAFFETAIDEAARAINSTSDSPSPAAHDQHDQPLDSLRDRLAKAASNIILQAGFKHANEKAVPFDQLPITPTRVGQLAAMRAQNLISAQAAAILFSELCEKDQDPAAAAQRMGLLQVRDHAALAQWITDAINDPANDKAVADLRAGKQQAIGRLVGDVMKRSQGRADAQEARERILKHFT